MVTRFQSTGSKALLLPSLQARPRASPKGCSQDRPSHQREASHREEESAHLVSIRFCFHI